MGVGSEDVGGDVSTEDCVDVVRSEELVVEDIPIVAASLNLREETEQQLLVRQHHVPSEQEMIGTFSDELPSYFSTVKKGPSKKL